MTVGQLSFSYKNLKPKLSFPSVRWVEGGGERNQASLVFSVNNALKISMQSQEENNSDSLQRWNIEFVRISFVFALHQRSLTTSSLLYGRHCSHRTLASSLFSLIALLGQEWPSLLHYWIKSIFNCLSWVMSQTASSTFWGGRGGGHVCKFTFLRLWLGSQKL